MSKMNDETLSAFLDGELSARERAEVRESLARDPALGERLEALAIVDGLVKKQSRALDDRPLPEGVLRLLREQRPRAAGNVIPLHFRRRLAAFAGRHAALAAGLALVFGFATGWFAGTQPRTAAAPALAAYAAALDRVPSGETVALGGDAALLGRLSFQDTENRFCRQYRLQSPGVSSENVACREGGNWTLIASLQLPSAPVGAYRPASGPRLLDGLLDGLMRGGALSLEEEAAFLAP